MSSKQYYYCQDEVLSGQMHCQDRKLPQCETCMKLNKEDLKRLILSPISPQKTNVVVSALADSIENAKFIIIQTKTARTMLSKENQDIIVAALRGEL